MNGGMPGSDTHVLSIPHAHVDITGVRGDVMECIPLVQCASVVETIDEGNIIILMSQYAHKPDSKTIHSKSQLEHFGGLVYDSVETTGGHQLIVTHEGYVIPLHVQNELFYMDMQLTSDEDLDLYPHVFLTADSPWNPDVIDEEFFYDSSDCLSDVPHVQLQHDACDPHVNAYGETYVSVVLPHDPTLDRDEFIDSISILSQMMK